MADSLPVKKQRNAPQTRARILVVAQQAFAETGYSQTSLREIARSAGVAPSLLLRYFGSKPALFGEALLHGLYTAGVFDKKKDGFGKRMARMVVNEAEVALTAMIVLATGDPDARQVVAKIAREHIIKGLADWLGPPNAQARALNIVMLLNGFMLFSRQLPLGILTRHNVTWLATSLQAIVDEGRDVSLRRRLPAKADNDAILA